MPNFKRLLPSASALIVFEAAGRHENFTRAAEELGMTQAAVSYAVRAMEGQLGVLLFHRNHRNVALTEAGARFHADVSAGLTRIQKSAEAIRAKGRETNVTLAASTAFASMWMLPRITRLRDARSVVNEAPHFGQGSGTGRCHTTNLQFGYAEHP